MSDDLDLGFERSYVASTLHGATRSFHEAHGPGHWVKRLRPADDVFTIVKLHGPPDSRDAVIRAAKALGDRLPKTHWQVLPGSNSDDGQFHLVLQERPRATVTTPAPALGSHLPPWLARLMGFFSDTPVAEPPPDDELVREAMNRATRRARLAAQPLPGQRLRGATVTFLYASWRPALERHVQANRKRGIEVTLNYVDGTLPPDVLGELVRDSVRIDMHYGQPLASAETGATLPPDAFTTADQASTLPPLPPLQVEFRRNGRQASALLAPDAEGEITLGRCGAQAPEVTALLKQVEAELRISAQPRNALRLRPIDNGLLVTAAGHPDYFRLVDGQPLQQGARLPLPVSILANGVRIELRPAPRS